MRPKCWIGSNNDWIVAKYLTDTPEKERVVGCALFSHPTISPGHCLMLMANTRLKTAHSRPWTRGRNAAVAARFPAIRCSSKISKSMNGKGADKATVHDESPNGSFALSSIGRIAVTTEVTSTIERSANQTIKRSAELKESGLVRNCACPASDKQSRLRCRWNNCTASRLSSVRKGRLTALCIKFRASAAPGNSSKLTSKNKCLRIFGAWRAIEAIG